MKVLIIEAAQISPYLEIGLEIAELNAKSGNKVYYCHISKHLPFIIEHQENRGILRKLYICIQKNKIEKTIDDRINYSDKLLVTKNKKNSLRTNIEFDSIERLKEYEWNGYDAGMGAASTLITIMKEPKPNTIKNKSLINTILWTFKIIQKSAENWMSKTNPDKVYICNGRVAEARAILRVCEKYQIPFVVYDIGYKRDSYSCWTHNQHNLELLQQDINNHWKKSLLREEVKKMYAEKYFLDKRLKLDDDRFKSFTKHQTEDLLPINWTESKYNVVFFTSSTDEYEAITDFQNIHTLFPDQITAINEIGNFLKKFNDVNFYVRIHPHAMYKGASEKITWRNLENNKALNVIPAKSKIDSYRLIDKADLILTYCSTIAIEASYWNKPSIIVARAKYDKLNASYNPSNRLALWSLIKNRNLKPQKKGIYIFGYYQLTYGKTFKYYKIKKNERREFKGIQLNGGYILNIINYFIIVRKKLINNKLKKLVSILYRKSY